MSSSAMAEMIVTASNVLGVEQAEIPLPKAAPLGVLGPNAAGKSSLATAIGAVLSREANPLGLAPTARPYFRQGADYGEVLLSGPGGTEYVRWVLSEKAMRVFAEAPEPLHPAAVGLTDFISRASARARGEIWESAFLPPPEQIEDELKKELRSALAGERMVSDVIDILREQGWESVEGVYRAKAKESKREWSSITGEPYGTSKAPNWTPPGWRSDYDGVTPLEAEAALGDARDALQALHVSGAVSAAEAQQAKDAAEKIPELRERKDEAARRLEEARKTAAAVEGEIAGIRADGFETKNKYEEHQRSKPRPSDGRPCPLCGGKIVVRDRALYAAEDEAAFAERIKEWEKRGEELGDSLDFLRQKLAAAKRKGRPILEQRERAENVKADADADLRAAGVQAIGADSPLKADESEERIALAEQEIESRREALELIRKRSEATEAHRSVSYYALIAELLGPRGIRGRAMKAGLERLAKGLGRVHELTNWPLVKLDPSYAVSAGERPVALCSTSEQWRAQTALQIALALALDNNYAVLDGADVLDALGLMELGVLCDSLAADSGLSLVVCATGCREMFPEHWATVTVQKGRISEMLTPRDYQLADVKKLRLVLRRVRAVIYQLPTGAGKTIVAGYIASLLADRGKRALVLVHRRELVRQFSKTLTQAGLGDQYGIIAAGRAETRWARFQIASVQSINRRETGWLKPDLVIVDEAHHVKAKTWENVLGRFPDTKVLGLTATPGRLDGKPLGDHFDTLVQGPSIGELVEQGDLAPMRVLRPEQGLSTAGVSTMAGDWNKKDLDERLTDQVIAAGAAAYRRYGAGKRAIFFAVNRRHSKAIVESLSKEGFRAEHIDAETDVRRRDLVLKEFGEGLIQVVSNVDLISEGTDVPECEVIMMGRPTKSVTMYLQQAGRAMRPGEGKTALLLDLAGNSWDLGLPDEERSWDLEGTRQGAAVDKRPVGMRQRCCSACAEVYSSRLLACPSCGTEHVLPKPLEVETELSEAAPSERTPKMISRREMKSRLAAVMRRREGYEGLVRIGKDFGYKPGWARLMAEVLKVPIDARKTS